MRRFSFKTTALLTLPCLVIPLAAWLLPPLFRAQNGIEVLISKRRAPTAAAASHGADVGAIVKLNERPDDNSYVTWTTSYRVDAGTHALWNPEDGDIERKISKSSSRFDGAWNEWKGDFDLRSVPKEWGDVVLSYNARLLHTFGTVPNTTTSVRLGKIILRRAGETFEPRAVDRNPHLRLLDYDLSLIKRPKSGVVYRLNLFFKSDSELYSDTSSDFSAMLEFKGISNDAGRGEQERTLEAQGASSDSYHFASKAAQKANRISTFTLYYDPMNCPRSARVQGKLSFHDGWPLHFSIPFSDGKGRVLIHRGHTKAPS